MGPGRNIGIVIVNWQLTKRMLIDASQVYGQQLRISGWGKDQTELFQKHLKIGHVGLVDLAVNGQLTEAIFFGEPIYGQWNCQGDSGGKY